MALAGAPGGENPSAAFLAGQQHGQTLATQHAAKPAAAKPKPTAAPSKPKPGKPASPPAQTLLQQAQAIAKAQTDAQIAAIRQQQDLYNQQGAAKAGQINSATQAAAQLLKDWNLGGQTADSYNQAAQTIGSLAGGFSGQTGTDARSAAAQVQANLANLGAPEGGAKTSTGQVSDPAALQNVLYGLGGFIPGNLLETTGQAQAAVARGLPGSLLSYGQNQAAGALSAGQAQADTLTPQIVDAQGKLPQLVQTALAGLSDAQQRAFTNRLAVAKYNTGISEFNANQKVKVANYNLAAQRLLNSQSNSDRAYKIQLENLGIKQAASQRAAVAAQYKLENGGYTKLQLNKFNSLLQQGVNAIQVTKDPKTGANVYSVPDPTDKSGKRLVAISYTDFVKQAVSHGVPPQLAVDRANSFFPAEDRPQVPGVLDFALGTTSGGPGRGSSVSTTSLGKFARVDQGVDFVASTPVKALVPGRVVSITKGMAGGTGHIIKVMLDHPVTVNGRTYYGIYYSEQSPLVKVGQHLRAGMAVMGAGGNEIGFLDQHMQMPPLVGGLGAGTQPSVGGQDFYAWLGGQ